MPLKPSLRMRTWGTRFDTLPVSPPAHDATDPADPPPDSPEALATEPVLKRKEEKMPHDASVFVGSLPANIDQQELTRLLSDHLSEHTEVKNIKVIRDSKGGVCAFVQCEDAASAASLINTLHSSTPKQLLGRTLRYEPARAFRTLLISYRTPMQHIPAYGLDANSNPQVVELNLPTAMRAWRPRNSKFYSLLYNSEAIDAENYMRTDATVYDKPSLFLQPVTFDAETINTIAAYFGPLESFSPFQSSKSIADSISDDVSQDWKLYPSPHDAPRSAKMDTGCWEIKWEHRDDCVSALMTLRRVPHLTATWAHQPPPFGFEQRSPYIPFPQNNFPQYPLHVQDQMQLTRTRAASLSDPFDFSRPLTRPRRSSHSTSASGASGTQSEKDVAYAEDASGDASSVRWSDMDFPPLGNTRRSLKTGSGVWSERHPEGGRSRSASLSLSQQNVGSFSTSMSRLEDDSETKESGQELDIPSTPGLGRSPFTPKTPGFPTTPDGAMQKLSLKEGDNKEHGYYNDFIREREIDPTTLFVGGLETFGPGAWDEEKVTKFFSRFGGLEEVKIIRPLNSHAAFAFVKFNNTEAPARAVFEEVSQVVLCESSCETATHREALGSQTEDVASSISKNLVLIAEPQGQAAQAATAVEAEPSEAEPPVYTETKAPEETPEFDEAAPADVPESSPSPPFTSLSAPTSETYREWYDGPVSVTPPPTASFNTSMPIPTAASALPYSVPGSYYTAPWMHPYGQPMHFPMPYFPGYAVPGQPQMHPHFQRPPGVDGGATGAPGTWPHMGMYGPLQSYIPYHTPPTRTPTVEPTPSQQALNSRAPLAPTGFIQNEQGTLIAVYQPEALDQYMSGAQVAPPALPQHPAPNIPSWTPYTPPTVYPAPGPAPTVAMPSRPTLPSNNMAWIPNQRFAPPQPHSSPHVPQTPRLNIPAGALRGGYPDGGGPAAPLRRHQTRRDQGGSQNNQARNNHPRSFQTRNARGNMPLNVYHGHGDAPSGPRNNHLNSSEWNQWGAAGPR
ncbi:hypothetical protein C0991_009145 [Blastosporella zonata]|nr:hypothetical protein C0991_009145 [Blastosporella zonata]